MGGRSTTCGNSLAFDIGRLSRSHHHCWSWYERSGTHWLNLLGPLRRGLSCQRRYLHSSTGIGVIHPSIINGKSCRCGLISYLIQNRPVNVLLFPAFSVVVKTTPVAVVKFPVDKNLGSRMLSLVSPINELIWPPVFVRSLVVSLAVLSLEVVPVAQYK